MHSKRLPVLLPLVSLLLSFRAFAQSPQLIGVLDTTDYLSYSGFQPDIHLSSPCSQSSFSGGVAGVFTGSKTQGGNTVTASVDYLTRGLSNGVPMTAYSTGSLAIYALAPPNTPITLTGKRTGSTMVTSSGATVSASAPNGQHTSFLPGGPSSVAINDNLFPNGNFVTGAANGSCPGYSYVTSVDVGTYLVVNNNCPGTTCGTAEAIVNITVQSSSNKLTITTPSLPDGIIGRPYPQTQLQATGGSGNYSWGLTAGSPLPDGLTLDPATGSITGAITNTAESASNFDPLQREFSVPVTVMDSSGMTASAPLSITVTCGDDRDTVIGDPSVGNPPVPSYISFGVMSKLSKFDPGVPFAPRCMDFSQSPTSSLFYTFSELNHSNTIAPAWALLSTTLINSGLDSWYRNMFVSIALGQTSWNPSTAPFGGLNSAYRTPADQIRVYQQQGSTNPPRGSRHMFGDAADLANVPATIENWWALYTNAQDATPPASWIEPYGANFQCSSNANAVANCVHADWRQRPVPFAGH